MISFKQYISEALKMSQWRPLVKKWDSKRLEAEFLNEPYEKDRKAFRLYIPVESDDTTVIEAPAEIVKFLDSEGYDMVDYAKGLAKRKGSKRETKLGKILPSDLMKSFVNDPSRTASKKISQMVVISRHPYDIGGMSTDRGWSSCMNLKGGSRNAYVPMDIEAGTLIAYVTDSNDKNLKNPMGRILYKPFVNLKGETYFVSSDAVYGSIPWPARKVIENWIEDFNKKRGVKGLFVIDQRVYKEVSKSSIEIGEVSEVERAILNKDFKKLKKFKDLPEYIQLAAIEQSALSFKFIRNPTDKVKLEAVRKDPSAIEFIKDPSEELQIIAVKLSWTAILAIKNPIEKVQLMAVAEHPSVLRSLKNPSEKVQAIAIAKSPHLISYIENPSENIQMIAAKNMNPVSFPLIKNPTEQVKKIMQSRSN